MNAKYSSLLESLTLHNGIVLKNRIVMAPMTHCSSNPDGTVSDAELDYYARRSAGAGMVITACTYVTPNGKGFPGQFSADDDSFIPSLRRLAAAIQSKGAKAVLQIFHGGRLCPPDAVPNGDVVSASAVASEREGAIVPRALESEEIHAMIKRFGDTTRRAIEAGFDGVEIHGANGYLIQQFFSPHANRREDEWGGSVEKRLAFPLALVDEIQDVVAKHAKQPFIVGYRFSPEEAETPGITMAETFVLLDALAAKSIDYLHISLNEFWSAPRRGVDDSRSRVEIIQERIGDKVPVIGVGGIHTAEEAAKAMETGIALLALGRELIIEPDWVEKVASGRESEIATFLTKEDQQRLVIPDPLWQMIIQRAGWFPVQ
ncbi:NADH-dependent flavin oxidoreductase [Paenibacillus rigui]|uniref:NADH-dependent flavin oxidoreductase n=1 Tax=Paenibacillus rigui TaxID=554312 RepID=A0A229UWL2_9BACL|nr:NADH-dependent flavin oxidoreductase [Paenibacillus rigui]OXM87713.1 NADH-dependent flavin oxidoreductase [Paenibacillus rigui]